MFYRSNRKYYKAVRIKWIVYFAFSLFYIKSKKIDDMFIELYAWMHINKRLKSLNSPRRTLSLSQVAILRIFWPILKTRRHFFFIKKAIRYIRSTAISLSRFRCLRLGNLDVKNSCLSDYKKSHTLRKQLCRLNYMY